LKKIFRWLIEYFKTEFHPVSFLVFAIMLATCIWINYGLHFDSRVMDRLPRGPVRMLTYFLFYGLPWLLVAIVHGVVTKKTGYMKSGRFWLTAFFAFTLIAFVTWAPFHMQAAAHFFSGPMHAWANHTFWNAQSMMLYFPILLAFWLLFDRRQTGTGFYGLSFRGFDPWPYMVMLLIVLPGIIWASYQQDFLQAYPTYKAGSAERYLQLQGHGERSWIWTSLIYEVIYALDFASIELFFRGFLVFAFVKYMGKGAILPMVAMYCFLHFGKPMGEAISSIFGGFVLGIIAYHSKSIFGGILVHVGVALSMDITAWIRHFSIQSPWTLPLH